MHIIDNVYNKYSYRIYRYIYNNIVVGKEILKALYKIGELLAKDVPFEAGCLFVLIIWCHIEQKQSKNITIEYTLNNLHIMGLAHSMMFIILMAEYQFANEYVWPCQAGNFKCHSNWMIIWIGQFQIGWLSE